MGKGGMQLPDLHRNRLRLWRRWQVTFDWFNFPAATQRVHSALLVHQHAWTTRALADYTNLPQTTVRRQLLTMLDGGIIDRTADGVRMNELGIAFAVRFHRELETFVRGGRNIDPKLLRLLKQAPNNETMNWEMLESHVWWPIIDAPGVFDA